MAKTTGLRDYFVQLDSLVNMLSSKEVVNAAEEAWEIIGSQIRQNAIAKGLVLTGLMVDPRSILTHAGVTTRDGKKTMFAETGVFKDDTAMASYPHPSLNRVRDVGKDIPPAMVAYWLEFGVQPHYTISGVRARKTPVNGDTGVNPHKGITPNPFISSAYDTKLESAFNALKGKLNDLIDKAIK